MLDTWYAPSWGVTPESLATRAFDAPRLNNPEVARMWSADAVVRALPSVSLGVDVTHMRDGNSSRTSRPRR